jgi:hypothetical protein
MSDEGPRAAPPPMSCPGTSFAPSDASVPIAIICGGGRGTEDDAAAADDDDEAEEEEEEEEEEDGGEDGITASGGSDCKISAMIVKND